MPQTPHLRVLGLAVLLAVSACVLAACGSSSSTSSSSTGTQAAATGPGGAQRSSFRTCLKQHGVTLPQRRPGAGPPPGGGAPGGGAGGGFFGGGGGAGLAQRNPKLAAAVKACGGVRFGGGRRFRLGGANITKYVSCVRAHGYNLPSPNLSGKGPVFPASIRANPKFLAASRACQTLLFPPGGPTSSPAKPA